MGDKNEFIKISLIDDIVVEGYMRFKDLRHMIYEAEMNNKKFIELNDIDNIKVIINVNKIIQIKVQGE